MRGSIDILFGQVGAAPALLVSLQTPATEEARGCGPMSVSCVYCDASREVFRNWPSTQRFLRACQLWVMRTPLAPSDATWKMPAPKLGAWKLRLAAWLAVFESCSTPVDEL